MVEVAVSRPIPAVSSRAGAILRYPESADRSKSGEPCLVKGSSQFKLKAPEMVLQV